MPLSGDYLIHRARDIDTLKKILITKKFLYGYCQEKFRFGSFSDKSGEIAHQFTPAVPMISFSDLNIKYLNEHINNGYGHFGICMSKSWAEDKGFNPVLYVDNHSLLGIKIYELYMQIDTEMRQSRYSQESRDKFDKTLDLIGYIKNYSNVIPVSSGKVCMGYEFYNEREWRKVCPEGLFKCICEEVYQSRKEEFKECAKEKWETFEYSDIKFLFVENIEQKQELINFCNENSININFDEVIFTLDEKGINYSGEEIK